MAITHMIYKQVDKVLCMALVDLYIQIPIASGPGISSPWYAYSIIEIIILTEALIKGTLKKAGCADT